MILSRTNGRRATMIYIASVVVTAIGLTCLIDCLLPIRGLCCPCVGFPGACHQAESAGWFTMALRSVADNVS